MILMLVSVVVVFVYGLTGLKALGCIYGVITWKKELQRWV